MNYPQLFKELVGFPLEPVLVHVLLLAIVAGDNNNVIFRTRDEDISLVSKLTTLALNTLFGYNVHRLKCHSTCANLSPSEFLQSLFFRHRCRTKLPLAPSISIDSTAHSRQTSHSTSHPSESIIGWEADQMQSSNQLRNTKTHFRNPSGSRGSAEPLKLPSVVVVSGLELANLPSQKALLRTLTERKISVSDVDDPDGPSLELPDGFFIVYVCRSDPRERPLIHKSLLDRFAMSSSVDVGAQTRLTMRQYRAASSPSTTTLTSGTSAVFPTSLQSLSGLPTPLQLPSAPVIPSDLIQKLKHLCATKVHIRPPLNIYLADLFSATRHYGPLDAMMLTARARQDAEALIRANRVLGADSTGAELIQAHAERFHETASVSTYPYSHPSTVSASSVGLMDGLDAPEPYETTRASSLQHSLLASQPELPIELDVSEADVARMFPRVVSHRIRVRDSPFDEVLSSAVCGAVSTPGDELRNEETVQWERETVKDILVHILAEV